MGLVADDCWGQAMGNGFVEYRLDSRRRNSSPYSMISSLTEFSERTGSTQPDLGDLCDIGYCWCNTAVCNHALQPDSIQHGHLNSNSRSDRQISRLPHSRSQHCLALSSPTALSPQETLREPDKRYLGLNKGTTSSNTTPNSYLPPYSGGNPSWSAKYQLTDGKSRQPHLQLRSRSSETNPELPPPRPSKPGVEVSSSIKRKQRQTKEFWSPLLKTQKEFPSETTQEIKTSPKFPEVMNQPAIPSKSTESRKQQPISLTTTQLNNPPPIPPKPDEKTPRTQQLLPPKQEEKTPTKNLSNLYNKLSNIDPSKQRPLPPKTSEISKYQQTVPKELPESKNGPLNLLPLTARRDQPPLPPKPSEKIKLSQDQQTLPKQLSESNNEHPYLLPIISRRDQPPLPPKPPETIKFSPKHDQQTLPKQLIEPSSERQITPVLPAIPPKSTEAVKPLPIPPTQNHRTHQPQLPELNDDPPNLPLLPPREQPPALPQRLKSTAAASSSDDETTSVAPLTPSSPRNPSNQSPRHRGSGVGEPHCILRRQTLTVVSVFSFLLSILSVALLVLVQINPFVYSWKDRTFKEGQHQPCVTCFSLMSNLASSMFDEDLTSLDMRLDKGEVFCCARTNKEMSSLLKLVIRQQDYEAEPSAGRSDSNEAVINDHVLLDPQTGDPKKDVYNNNLMRIHPKDSMITALKDSRATDKDFFLTISASGWYYVYSSIFYNTNCSNRTFKTFEHFIVRFKPHDKAKSGVLTKTVHTCCKTCVEEKRSIFTGGVFELFKGDQLYASVNDITALDHDNVPSSYMGYSMLGE